MSTARLQMNAAELPAAGSPPHPSGNDQPPAAAPNGPVGQQGNAPSGSVSRQAPTPSRLDGFDSKLRDRSSDLALARCRNCGVPNGRTASVCWGCEADLAAQGPLWFVDPAAPAATTPDEPGASPSAPIKPARSVPPADPGTSNADVATDIGSVGDIPLSAAEAPPAVNVKLELPVLTSVVQDDDRMLAFARVRTRPQRLQLAIFSGLAFAAIAGVAGLLVGRDAVFIALDKSPPTQVRATADAGPAVLRVEAPANAASAPNLPIDSGSPATAEPVEAPATVMNAAQPAAEVPMRASQRDPQRGPQRASQIRPQLAAPRSEATRPLSVPPGPCTSAVFALGLCSAGQSPTKN